ncbi:MAG TPA: hypothetical protein ENF41_00305 [Candidatus Bathyarchaeota archaeon]|nr:hypothetical protein [Candidatus Bathyarchaeota archaeon]
MQSGSEESQGITFDDVTKYGGVFLAGAASSLLIEHRDKILDLIRGKKEEGASDEEIKQAVKEALEELQTQQSQISSENPG